MQNEKKKNLGLNEEIEIIVNRRIYKLCNECYQALGWKTIYKRVGITSVKIVMQRNRSINNKMQLCKLQRELEDAITKMEKIVEEKNKKRQLSELNKQYDQIYKILKNVEKTTDIF